MKYIVFVLIIACIYGYVIGIDFGSQYIKVAYQPFNKPPDIVLDPSGKRKIDNAVYFAEDQRVFGNNAIGSSFLKPEYVFTGMNELLGQGEESNKPASIQQRGFPYSFQLTERNTWALKLLPGSGFESISSVTVEEMNAMILNYILSIVENEFNEKNRDVVISIPSIFSQEQRQALLDAAKLANIRVLALIDQTTASAITFAMTRHNEGIKRVLFIDVGAHSTEVSAAQLEAQTENGVTKHNVIILGKEAESVGGEDFTNVVASIIAEYYEKEYKVDPRQDMKTMNRLRLQSRKYKEILSANREVLINEANLMNGHDIQFILNREEFEEDSASLLEKVLQPVTRLLEKIHIPITEFDEMQIVGGSSRIPMVKEALAKHIHPVPIKANLNGDESAALGCVFYTTGSKFARNKLEKVYDLPYFTTYTSFYRPSIEAIEYMQMKDEDYITANNGRVPSVPIFVGNGYEKERSFTFPVRSNFRVEVGYKNLHSQKTVVLEEYLITDIPTIIEKIENHVESNVTIQFQMDEFGIVRLKKAELTSRYISQEDRIAYQRRSFNPFYSRNRDPRALLYGRKVTNPLTVTSIIENVVVLPLSKQDFKDSKRKLKEMDYRDERTKREQKLLNQYESVLYDAELEEEEESFIQHTTPEEVEWLNSQLAVIKEYIQNVHDKKILFDAKSIKGTIEEVKVFLETVDKRIMSEMEDL